MAGDSATEVVLESYSPGALGEVCALQSRYYAKHWHFGRAFETKVAREMAEFLDRLDPQRDQFRVALRDGRILGSVTLDGEGQGETAHLRWFIMSDEARGTGIGRWLLEDAVGFARGRGFSSVYLWTFQGLEAARHLYESLGFRLSQEVAGETWGTQVVEQRFDLRL